MTNITGKIYQMKNADGTENRFPRTVIEAVLGLSSYLQDQFSSLADIYMPIEGIYEALTGQEFVYRKSPNTIKAKSFNLDRIQGKTLAWNQLVASPNGEIDSDYTTNGCTLIYNATNKEATIAASGTPSYMWIKPKKDGHNSDYDDFIAGHRYLFQVYAKAENASGIIFFGQLNASLSPRGDYAISKNATTSYRCFTVITPAMELSHTYGYVRLGSNTPASTTGDITFKALQIIDLTLLYGSEIDGLTDAEILTKFESEYPGYHDYSAGKLISNDAKQLETVGRNVWDEEWEVGTITLYNGQNARRDTDIRSKNYIRVFPGQQYYVYSGNIQYSTFYTYLYDANKNYFEGRDRTIIMRNGIITIPAGCYYIRFTLYECSQGYGNVYRHDICINLSDESFNGQYEPYKKSTLPLNLDDFWVKDGHGNQAHITGGLKSAGSVYDEIVGNKYIKRIGERAYQSGDESNSSVITDSTNTYYALATPIEYDLVEPLIYTMKAGITEARISPNEDGLSAPFCCDMTYSANENNDAGNAQYAATAGRLLNSHKIWGQDFNGTGDITGELIGVTNLTASGIITGSRLVSTVATGTAPLTVASTTMVQNLVAEKASKLLTARTIWGQSFDGSGNISGAISNITTLSASGLATIAGGIALGTSTKAQAAKMVWSEDNNAWHLQGNLYVDGSVTAGVLNESSPSVDISPYVIECNNWANSGRGYIPQNVLSDAIAKYKAGYQVHSNGYNTTNTYLLTGISETSLELYFNGDSGFTLSMEA